MTTVQYSRQCQRTVYVTKVTTMCLFYERLAAWECYRLAHRGCHDGTRAYFDASGCTGAPHGIVQERPHSPTSIHDGQAICVSYFLAGLEGFSLLFSWLTESRIYRDLKSLSARCLRGSTLRNVFNMRSSGICQITIPHSYGRVGSFCMICERVTLAAIISLRGRRPLL